MFKYKKIGYFVIIFFEHSSLSLSHRNHITIEALEISPLLDSCWYRRVELIFAVHALTDDVFVVKFQHVFMMKFYLFCMGNPGGATRFLNVFGFGLTPAGANISSLRLVVSTLVEL
jgi:hypothetical protein